MRILGEMFHEPDADLIPWLKSWAVLLGFYDSRRSDYNLVCERQGKYSQP